MWEFIVHVGRCSRELNRKVGKWSSPVAKFPFRENWLSKSLGYTIGWSISMTFESSSAMPRFDRTVIHYVPCSPRKLIIYIQVCTHMYAWFPYSRVMKATFLKISRKKCGRELFRTLIRSVVGIINF